MADFVGIGFCSNDYLSILPCIPLDSKVQIQEHLVQGGGPAATSTVAAARLGMSAAFISTVGDDDPGRRILADFAAEHVDTTGIVVRPNASSPIAYCWIDGPTGKRSIAWYRGTLPELQGSEVNLDLVRQAKVLHIDGHNPLAALAAVKEARKCGVLVNFDAGTIRPGVDDLLPYTDLLICSEAFARKYTNENDLEKALRKLDAQFHAKVTGATMGEDGSILLDGKGGFLRCPAFKMNPVDTTGCGDVFHAAFAVRYVEMQDLLSCMRFASAVSAIKCLKLGGRAGIPNRAQVDRFLSEHP